MATAAAKSKDEAHSGRLLLRMPPELHSELARAAEREGQSLNAYITSTLAGSLGGGAPRSAAPTPGPSRFMRIAVIADLVMVAIATIAAIALLIVAWP
jgi:hypothetical protein